MNTKAVHVVFGKSPVVTVKIMLRELGLDHQESVLCFSHLFSVGPIYTLHEENGWNHRIEWFKSRQFSVEEQDFLDFKEKIRLLQPDMTIYIWTGESAHEQIGLRYAHYLLKECQKIVVIHTTQDYTKLFYRPDSQVTFLHMGEMISEDLALIYEENKEKQILTQQERNRFTQEWECLAESDDSLRIWKDGHIHSVEEDYYDSFIIEKAKQLHRNQPVKDFLKSSLLVAAVICDLEQYIGDCFIDYRIKQLIKNGTFEIKGNPKGMRFYSIKVR